MSVIASPRARRRSSPNVASEPRTVCLTFGPAPDVSHLLRVAAEALEDAGAAATAIEPSADADGAWLRVTCEVDPVHVATLVAMPSLGDHRVDHARDDVTTAAERCSACELRAYLRVSSDGCVPGR